MHGKKQSPINIDSSMVIDVYAQKRNSLPFEIGFHYPMQENLTVLHTGHSLFVSLVFFLFSYNLI